MHVYEYYTFITEIYYFIQNQRLIPSAVSRNNALCNIMHISMLMQLQEQEHLSSSASLLLEFFHGGLLTSSVVLV